MLQGDFDGIAKNIAKEVNSLISDREIISTKQKIRARAEHEIRARVPAIHLYLKDDDREKYISHEKIFTIYMPDA